MEKFRMFHVVQAKNELPKQAIASIIHGHRIIKKYFYALNKENVWHILFCLDSNMISENKVFEWFKIPSLQVKGIKGRGALMREINEVIDGDINSCETNLDISQTKEKAFKKDSIEDEIEHCFYQVEYKGVSLKEAKKNHSLIFNTYTKKLNKLRIRYLINESNKPDIKFNWFVRYDNSFSTVIAYQKLVKNFYPICNNEDIYFMASEPNMLDGYDGQPIIIWKNITGEKLLKYFGGEKNLLAMLNNNPRYKSDTIPNCNRVNIFSSEQTFDEFISSISDNKANVLNAFLMKIDDT